MLVASKYEEIYSPEVADFLYISADTYSREDILKMEKLILLTLDFNLASPTTLTFLRRYSKAALSDSSMHTVSKYLSELSLLEYSMLQYLPSMVAASSVYLARLIVGVEGPVWVEKFLFLSDRI